MPIRNKVIIIYKIIEFKFATQEETAEDTKMTEKLNL